MTAMTDYRQETARSLSDKVVAHLPESAFGNTEWVTMTARTGAEHLRAAIASNRPYRVANAIRSMAHTPSLDEVEILAHTICDAIVGEGYATHHTETIAQVTNARQVVAAAINELRGKVAPASPELSLLRETVDGYARLVGLHDPNLSERLEAVATFGERLARFMKLPPSTVLDVELAGRLHDIGMIQIPRSNRGRVVGLSKKDHDRLNRHSITGESFLSTIPSLARLAPIVRSHHERYDGQGYPDGLCGDEIPLASRVISVAGAFVDLVTDTPHREAISPDDACRELALRAGTEFDPAIVSETLTFLHFRQHTNQSA